MFRSFGPSSGSLRWALLKLHFCKINQEKYIAISAAVLWHHVFTECRAAAQHPVHTTQPETHVATTPQHL
jgi:hypothetical protein